jgi:hypothetical protein
MSRRYLFWLAGSVTCEPEVFVGSFAINSLFFLGIALFLSFSFCGAVTVGLLTEPETVRCGGFGRELALNLLAVTACIADPSTDFPMSWKRK